MLPKLRAQHGLGPEFNGIKFRTDELKFSFVACPAFESDLHPVLRLIMPGALARGAEIDNGDAGDGIPTC